MSEVVAVPNPSGTGPEIHVFDSAAIQAAVSKALETVPEGKSGAVVAYVDQSRSVQLAVAARLGEHWSIALEGKKPYGKPIEGKAAVVFVF